MYCTSVYFAKGSLKFTRQHVMNTIWDKRGVKLKGTMPDMIRYFFILSLNRSTWMRARDKSLLLIVSSFVNCFLPSLNGGISRVAPFSARRSCMVKPRSARTTSPGSILSKNPDFLVQTLKLHRVPHRLKLCLWNEICIDCTCFLLVSSHLMTHRKFQYSQ